MSLPVTIENEALRIEVWPAIGGKVSSVIDKADNAQLLFSYPAEIPTTPQYDKPYAQSWYAGWDECFPAIGPGKYPGFPYDGILIPDHGELWGLPTTAVPTRNGITTVWHGLRFGYRLTRKLFLDGPSLHSEYTLVNLAPFEMRFVWAQHALLSLSGDAQIEFDQPQPFVHSRPATPDRPDPPEPFDWPRLGDVDLSKPAALPTGQCWKVYSANPIAGAATVKYPSRARTLRIAYESADAIDAHWGLWINAAGWAGHHHIALEPTTGRSDHLDRAVRDRSAGRLAPLGKVTWAVRWTVG